MKVYGLLSLALRSALMLLCSTTIGVSALDVWTEEAFFSELNTYVESL